MLAAARVSAAAAVLDRWLGGEPVEKALTNWGRASRFAGSGDRAAVRDLVFEALRCKRSFAALGGALTGRGLMLGHARATGAEVSALFTGVGHAPAEVSAAEAGRVPDEAEALDCPDWLLAALRDSLGAQTDAVLLAMRQRAPVFLRVNLARTTPEAAVLALAEDGVVAELNQSVKTALEVTKNQKKIQVSVAYCEGLVELQDLSSQAVVAALPLRDGLRVLDHCAGGGGKTLAMAALADIRLWAHDANPRRMADLPARAARAGASVAFTENPENTGPYDLVFADVPCSGSGSWRRDPEGKWALTPDRLAATLAVQAGILDRTAAMVAPDGALCYATCSLLRAENEAQTEAFVARNPGWIYLLQRRFSPLDRGDGFYLAILKRK